MVETVMFMGIGFLFAALIGVAVMPLVHGRAVRLTIRRLKAALPQSMEEIQADKDQLRAEFAMSTRRLEMTVEHLKTRIASQLVELGKKGDAINRLKIELDTLKVAAAHSTEMATQANLVPVMPAIRQPSKERTWTRDEYGDVNRLLRVLARRRANGRTSRGGKLPHRSITQRFIDSVTA